VQRRIMLGTFVLSAGFYDAYYLKGCKVRTLLRRDFDTAFEQVDTILMPTSPVPAFKIGEMSDDPLQMYLMDVFTVTLNMAGLPGISIPCGFSRRDYRSGCSSSAKYSTRKPSSAAAHAYEQSTEFHKKKPEL
jgi:aspartyl-tRNA(Asn)/glutamyl-tRNA(Gln) amidotransferase subunit A